MFKNLVDYIKMTNEEDGITTDFNMPNSIYTDGTPDVEGMQKVLRLADELFKDMPRSKLDNAYVSRKQKFGDLYKNQMLIDAFNAWAVLSMVILILFLRIYSERIWRLRTKDILE